MARQFSPRTFLRQASNVLLARYFHEQGLLEQVDIAALPETKIEPVYEALGALHSVRRAQVESDFYVVHSLADEPGIQAILDEGQFHDLDLVAEFKRLEGFHDKVLLTLLDHRTVVEVAAKFREADELPHRYWYRRREGVPKVDARHDTKAGTDLASILASYFQSKEGRGKECNVDVYRRGERYYFFALPEDYGQAPLEYDTNGELQRRPRRPVFEVVFVYDLTSPALDTFFHGRKEARLELEKLFARVILQSELNASSDDRIYNLNAFKQRGVNFVYDASSGIDDVRVKLLRVSLLGGSTRPLTFEADPNDGREAIYDFVERVFAHGGNGSTGGLSLALANVTRVGIEAVYAQGQRRGRPTKTFYLTYPNGCTLGHDGRDAVLRKMLADSKIEPANPAKAAAKG